MTVTRLVDTNILVYRFDPRDPFKQHVAERILEKGLNAGDLVLPHQAIIEFVAAITRPRPDLGGQPLLSYADALQEAENLLDLFSVRYPDESILRTAMRGMAAYRLSWFDAHLWAYAEMSGAGEILSEDFEHGRRYGTVRVVDPFLVAANSVHELPPLYADTTGV
ncbi:PIN domain-containing protein [Marinihelvus fidelis]|uniref:Ribonuclease VapC n=1 Tax=Marinihelvus fidelis TaxID=2613842 RepID=A0A5N0TJE4_9GAMM|nr:PIN domain-containing protein [Marinihelvus fidelis]KAA9134016.1 PIN domain-containing protein [Marinihelvus fidelis]